jgi:hypothetical protein
MNGFTIKNIVYLLFIASIFYFIVGKVFKVVKFKKLNELNKGIYFCIFILLFYFFYKVMPILLFGNSKITEGMTLMDSISSQENSSKAKEESGESIDYTKGWDTADNFRSNYCSKTPIYVEQNFFDDRSKEMGNSEGGLMYGGRSELYDSTTKGMNKKFVEEFMKQIKDGNKVDNASFTKENGCSTNLLTDKGGTGTMSQMCNPKCNFKFTGKK